MVPLARETTYFTNTFAGADTTTTCQNEPVHHACSHDASNLSRAGGVVSCMLLTSCGVYSASSNAAI